MYKVSRTSVTFQDPYRLRGDESFVFFMFTDDKGGTPFLAEPDWLPFHDRLKELPKCMRKYLLRQLRQANSGEHYYITQ